MYQGTVSAHDQMDTAYSVKKKIEIYASKVFNNIAIILRVIITSH